MNGRLINTAPSGGFKVTGSTMWANTSISKTIGPIDVSGLPINENDLIVIVLWTYYGIGSTYWTDIDGFTQRYYHGGSGSSYGSFTVWTKTATASEPSSYTLINGKSTTRWALGLTVIQGANISNPVDAVSGVGAALFPNTVHTSPTISTTPGTMLFHAMNPASISTDLGFTFSTGMVNIGEIDYAGISISQGALAYELDCPGGNLSRSVTISNSVTGANLIFTINPAA